MTRHSPGQSWSPRLVAAVAFATLVSGGHPAAGQSLETLVQFQCSTVGCAPNGRLLQARDGFFYGTASEADYPWRGDGTVFRMDRNGGMTVLLSPARFFIEALDGFFYGTTADGGAFGSGSVYRMDTAGNATDLYAFDGTTAWAPGPLVQTADGLLYGIFSIPGTDESRLFRIDTIGNLVWLRPRGAAIRSVRMLLASSSNGFLYGTTYDGRVFRLSRHGQARILAVFPTVYLDLMEASDGFYGATIDGGATGAGTIFRMTRAGKVEVIHEFRGGPLDGANPYEAPIEGRDGNLYGTTGFGGAFGAGTVYRMDRLGNVTVLHSFGGAPDAGVSPIGELVQGDDGALYGTTVFGGAYGQGTAFRLRLETVDVSSANQRK